MVSFLTADLQGPGPSIFNTNTIAVTDILALDQLAVAAWPAPVNDTCDGWLLRFAHGVSRRANSAAPFSLDLGARHVDELIKAVEIYYQDHGLPPRFQISPAAEPGDLDARLAARGYEIETPVTIEIAPTHVLTPASIPVSVSTTAPIGWWDIYKEGFSRDASKIAEVSRDQPVYAAWRDEKNQIAAIGFGVIGGKWLGIFGMWTRPDLRGQGIGKSVIGALSTWAIEYGAIGLYLQVENSNTAARRLYERIGFRAVYGYHYRTHWTPS